jgi:hypothetical protein
MPRLRNARTPATSSGFSRTGRSCTVTIP